ncbi:MAG TPA: hypothetical protein PKD48_03785 [Sphingopyxis sp.]|nr:hypothetical protein [Sphingopyxis sp.]
MERRESRASMIWGLLYILLLAAVAIVVLRIGERESSFAILTAVAATLATVASLLISGSRYDIFSLLVMSVDLAVFFIFLAHALLSRRYWTLCLPAFQLITCVTHIAKYLAPEIVPRVYSAGQGFWAYPTILVILGAALWSNADRKARRADDVVGGEEGDAQGAVR